MTETEAAIRAEIRKAMEAMGLPPEKLALAATMPGPIIYEELERLEAPFELLALVGSWGDTLEDEAVADLLRLYNQRGTMFNRVIASVADDDVTAAIGKAKQPRDGNI